MNQNRAQLKHQTAFTLIEILIAIGVIVILVGILFLAGKGVIGSSAGKATHVTLAALNGMFGEFDSRTRLASTPANWSWYVNSVQIVNNASTGTPDFWNIPNVFNSSPDAMDAPGNVTVDSSDIRNASRAILDTQLAMNYILSMPNNRKALEQYRADQYMVPEWRASTTALPSPDPTNRVLYTGTSTTENPLYLTAMRVQLPGGARYICTANNASGSPSGGGQWAVDNGPVYPLLLDGFGNPIIFVPASGLRVRLLNGAKDYNDPTPNLVRTAIIVSPEGKVKTDPTGATPPYVLVPGRPFFASAGPDGDFARGDDNIYSFQP